MRLSMMLNTAEHSPMEQTVSSSHCSLHHCPGLCCFVCVFSYEQRGGSKDL